MDRESLKRHLNESYKELERRLERDSEDKDKDDQDKSGGVNSRYISTTDPDAAIVRVSGKAKLRYQSHRAVDSAYEVITATEVTPGDVNEAHMMVGLIESHQLNTETWVETVVADSKYGTISNYLSCYDRGIAVAVARMDKEFDRKITSLFESVKKILLDSFLLLESGVESEMVLRTS